MSWAVCAVCGETFGSDSAFDRHRTGSRELEFRFDDETTWQGRRCLSGAELEQKGWQKDVFGRWRLPRTRVLVPDTRRPYLEGPCEIHVRGN